MDPSPGRNADKVKPIRATYYPVPKPLLTPMARRMSLVERIKRAAHGPTTPQKENDR